MGYLNHTPGPPLAAFVECLWYFDGRRGAHSREGLLPTGAVDVIFNLSRECFQIFADVSGSVGPATLMLADEYPECGILSPLAHGGTGMTLHLHVGNADALARRAVEAGATMLMEPADHGHGERQCRLRDPFGHEWLLGHEIEKVSPEEMQRRFTASFGQQP